MKRGFTILETLVALMAMSLMFVGPVTLITKAIGNSYYSQNRIIASYLALEGVEYVLNYRDNNLMQGPDWLDRLDRCTASRHYCYVDVANDRLNTCGGHDCDPLRYDSSGHYYNYSSGVDTIFSRAIKIDTPVGGLSDEAKLSVTVSWPEKTGATRTYVLEREIFNWK